MTYADAQQHVRGPEHPNSTFVGYYLDVQAAGGKAAFARAALLQVLGLTEADVQPIEARLR